MLVPLYGEDEDGISLLSWRSPQLCGGQQAANDFCCDAYQLAAPVGPQYE